MLLEDVQPSFPVSQLTGCWLTSFRYRPEAMGPATQQTGEWQCHADIVYLDSISDRRLIGDNSIAEPRTEGRRTPFRNDIAIEVAGRHLVGQWKNRNDKRYFGCLHLAVLPGETVMAGHYTGLFTDVEVEVAQWKWVRVAEDGLDRDTLPGVVLKDPVTLHAMVQRHSASDPPVVAADVREDA